MYQALYRKWRPQTFDEVVGQKHITETLKNQVTSGRLSHAYIFIGTRGTGKTTCARILAKAVNCEHPENGNPCGKCAACRGIADGSIMDIIELDAASNNGVDSVRALREEAIFSPAEVKKRVYIIDEVHMLSISAFNALLKILEEPPEHLMFILATTELQKVPATVLSRCQRHSFKRIETDTLTAYLEQIASREGFDMTHDAAELIARLAEGGVRDALSLLDQCSAAKKIDLDAVYDSMGLAGNRRIAEILKSILAHDTAAVLNTFTDMWMNGKDPTTFLGELASLMRDVLMVKVSGGTSLTAGGYDAKVLKAFAEHMSVEQLTYYLNTVQDGISRMRGVKNPKMTAELCLVTLCDSTLSGGVEALFDRVARLEQQIKSGAFPPPPAEEAAPATSPEEDYLPAEPPFIPPEEPPFDPEFIPTPPAPPAPEPVAPSAAKPESAAAPGELDWDALCAAVKPKLPVGVRGMVSDPNKLRGRMEGNVLRLEALGGLPFGQFNRQNVLAEFAHEASRMLSRPVNCAVSEMKTEQRPTHDLNELTKFDIVKVIN